MQPNKHQFIIPEVNEINWFNSKKIGLSRFWKREGSYCVETNWFITRNYMRIINTIILTSPPLPLPRLFFQDPCLSEEFVIYGLYLWSSQSSPSIAKQRLYLISISLYPLEFLANHCVQ